MNEVYFYVTLIHADKYQRGEKARESLKANCTYVANDFWIYEGDIECLEEDDVVFEEYGEGVVPCLGDMNKIQLVELCKETFGIDVYHP